MADPATTMEAAALADPAADPDTTMEATTEDPATMTGVTMADLATTTAAMAAPDTMEDQAAALAHVETSTTQGSSNSRRSTYQGRYVLTRFSTARVKISRAWSFLSPFLLVRKFLKISNMSYAGRGAVFTREGGGDFILTPTLLYASKIECCCFRTYSVRLFWLVYFRHDQGIRR